MTVPQVCIASSYDEAADFERSREKGHVRSVVLRAFIQLWLFVANPGLRSLAALLFGIRRFSAKDVKGIVVYTVGTLGDNVLLLSAIAAIKRNFPYSVLTAIANCDGFSSFPARQILGNSPFIDRLVTLPAHPVQRQGFRIVENAPEAAGIKCDLFVNLSPFGNRGWIGAVVREMLFAHWLGARWATGFRMSTYSRKHYFNRVQHHFVKNEARRTAEVIGTLGFRPVWGEDLLPRNDKTFEKVTRLLETYQYDQSQPVVILNPGAKLAASHWPAERFGEIAAWLKEQFNCLVFVNGTEGETAICERVVQASNHAAVNLAGQLSILELIELLRRSALLVSNNTGPMTLAAMTGTPMVVICSTRFSPTFYMPQCDRMCWVFSFDEHSYSYDDTVSPAQDLLNINASDILEAIRQLDPFKPGA